MKVKKANMELVNFENKDEDVKVSIIISVYNGELYLRECLESIKNQLCKDIEIICVNDGSTDSSLNILQEFAKTDKRFKIISKRKENVGKARNIAIGYAKGKYLLFLDADDFFDNKLVQNLYLHAEKHKCDIVTYKVNYYDNEKKVFNNADGLIKRQYAPQKEVFAGIELGEHMLDYTMGQAWDKIFLRDFIINNEIRFLEQNIFEDAYFTISAIIKAQRISHIDDLLLHQRRNVVGSLTNAKDCYMRDAVNAFYKIREKLIENEIFEKPEIEKAFINRIWSACNYYFNTVSYAAKQEFYNILKEEVISNFNLEDKKEEYFFNKNYYAFLQKVKTYTYVEYIETNLCEAEEKAGKFYKKFLEYKNYCEGRKEKQISITNAEKELKSIKNSISYKIGRSITYIPRQVRDLYKKIKRRKAYKIKGKINICYITDNNFCIPTGVSITSLKENRNKYFNYKIYIFADNVTKFMKDKLMELSEKNFEIIIKDIPNRYKNLKISTNVSTPHVNRTALLKFGIANELNDENLVLYIDGDTIIQSNLIKLYKQDISKVYVAAVKDIVSEFEWHKNKVWYIGKNYFNSGMMLMNLKLMRSKNIEKELVEYRTQKHNFYMDQDAFNVVFKNNVKYVNVKWNFMNKLLYEKGKEWIEKFYNIKLPKKDENIFKKCEIIHCASDKKPWIYDIGNCTVLYKKYYKLSPFKDIPLSILPLPNFSTIKSINALNDYFTVIENYKDDLIVIGAIKDEGSAKWGLIKFSPKMCKNQIQRPKRKEGSIFIYDYATDYFYQQQGEEIAHNYKVSNDISILIQSKGSMNSSNCYARFEVNNIKNKKLYDFKSKNRGINFLIYSRKYKMVVDNFYVDTYEDNSLTIKRK